MKFIINRTTSSGQLTHFYNIYKEIIARLKPDLFNA